MRHYKSAKKLFFIGSRNKTQLACFLLSLELKCRWSLFVDDVYS